MKDRPVYLICLSVFPFMVCTGIIYSVLPPYIQSLGANKSQNGLVYSCGAASGMITAPFLGQLSDKIGRKKVLLLSMLLFAFLFGICPEQKDRPLVSSSIYRGNGLGGIGSFCCGAHC